MSEMNAGNQRCINHTSITFPVSCLCPRSYELWGVTPDSYCSSWSSYTGRTLSASLSSAVRETEPVLVKAWIPGRHAWPVGATTVPSPLPGRRLLSEGWLNPCWGMLFMLPSLSCFYFLWFYCGRGNAPVRASFYLLFLLVQFKTLNQKNVSSSLFSLLGVKRSAFVKTCWRTLTSAETDQPDWSWSPGFEQVLYILLFHHLIACQLFSMWRSSDSEPLPDDQLLTSPLRSHSFSEGW